MTVGTLRQQAYRYILDRIVSGELAGGSQVSELSLAGEIGISRTPVREAIGQLQMEGLVEQVPRFGTIVRTPARRDLVELFELREALESYAVTRAAERIAPEDVERLDRLCGHIDGIAETLRASGERLLGEESLRRFLAADMGFHMVLIRAAGNGRILKSVGDSRVLTGIFGRRRREHDLQIVERTQRFHRDILSAVRNGEAETARNLMADHIRASKAETLEHFERMGSDGESPAAPIELPADLIEELERIDEGGEGVSG